MSVEALYTGSLKFTEEEGVFIFNGETCYILKESLIKLLFLQLKNKSIAGRYMCNSYIDGETKRYVFDIDNYGHLRGLHLC